MKNENNLTPKQQKFVNEICKGVNPSQAYINAYKPTTKNKNTISRQANKLLNSPYIRPIIAENKKQIQEKINYSVEESFNKILEIQKQALEYKHEVVNKDGVVVLVYSPDLKTALKAEELKGKLLGYYTEKNKLEIEAKANIVINLQEEDANA